jgi:hypothetical protein
VSLLHINPNLNLKPRRTELGTGVRVVVRSSAGYVDGWFMGVGCTCDFSCFCCVGMLSWGSRGLVLSVDDAIGFWVGLMLGLVGAICLCASTVIVSCGRCVHVGSGLYGLNSVYYNYVSYGKYGIFSGQSSKINLISKDPILSREESFQ